MRPPNIPRERQVVRSRWPSPCAPLAPAVLLILSTRSSSHPHPPLCPLHHRNVASNHLSALPNVVICQPHSMLSLSVLSFCPRMYSRMTVSNTTPRSTQPLATHHSLSHFSPVLSVICITQLLSPLHSVCATRRSAARCSLVVQASAGFSRLRAPNGRYHNSYLLHAHIHRTFVVTDPSISHQSLSLTLLPKQYSLHPYPHTWIHTPPCRDGAAGSCARAPTS